MTLMGLVILFMVLDGTGILSWAKKEISAALAHRREMRLLKAREDAAWLRDKTIEGKAER